MAFVARSNRNFRPLSTLSDEALKESPLQGDALNAALQRASKSQERMSSPTGSLTEIHNNRSGRIIPGTYGENPTSYKPKPAEAPTECRLMASWHAAASKKTAAQQLQATREMAKNISPTPAKMTTSARHARLAALNADA